jgi:glucose/arabinose dehydrogenase
MHCRKIFHLCFTISLVFNGLFSFSQPALNYRRVITSLSAPVEIASAPDGSNRLYIVQKVGSIKVYDKSYNFLGDFVTVSGITINGERGLLSMAFHPDYKTNGLFFVYYTTTLGDIEVSRYKVSNNPNKADTTSRTIIITIPHRVAANHNGGKLSFGADGYLYFATGDGGNGGDPPNNAQNGKVLLGKMLRIDVNKPNPPLNYSIPPDNPFINDTTIADEIWAMGLRNPFRWSFDRRTHDMWIADVGQGAREEINFRKAGSTKGINYGWRCYEGKIAYNPLGCKPADQYISPIFDYTHNLTTGGSSVTGGYVYRGSEYPSLNGYYIFADYISNNQWMISDSSNTWIVRQQSGTFPRNIVGFGEGEDGSLYACSITEGAVYKIEAITGVQVNILDFAGVERYGITQLSWATTEQNILHYEVESSNDSINFVRQGIMIARNLPSQNNYRFADNIRGFQKKFYRLRIVNKSGQWNYSKTIAVANNFNLTNFIFPSVIRNNMVSLYISDTYDNLLLFAANGTIVQTKNIRGFKGRMDISVSTLSKGMYLVKLSNSKRYITQWIFVD